MKKSLKRGAFALAATLYLALPNTAQAVPTIYTCEFQYTTGEQYIEQGWSKLEESNMAVITIPVINENKGTVFLQSNWTVTVTYADGKVHPPTITGRNLISFGSPEYPIKEISFYSRSFEALTAHLVHVGIRDVSQSPTVSVSTGDYKDSKSDIDNVYGIYQYETSMSINTQAPDITITIKPAEEGSVFNGLTLNQLCLACKAGDSAKPLADCNLTVPQITDFEWEPVIELDGASFNTDIINPEQMVAELTPLFDPKTGEDADEPTLGEEAEGANEPVTENEADDTDDIIDGYYTRPAEAYFNGEGRLILKAPCSGQYRLHLYNKPTPGVYYADKETDININPNLSPAVANIRINGKAYDPKAESTFTVPYLNGEGWTNARIECDIKGAEIYYSVEGEPILVMPEEASGETETSKYIKRHVSGTDGMKLYNPKNDDPENRVDLTIGNRLNLLIAKNGASTSHVIGYATEGTNQTAIDTVGNDSIEEYKYYNLQGQRIATPEEPGIYIRKTGSNTEKIVVR